MPPVLGTTSRALRLAGGLARRVQVVSLRKRAGFTFVVCVLLALTGVCDDHPAIGTNAPNFTLQDQDGRNVTLGEQINKTVVLEWFDPDCEYTKRDIALKSTKAIAEKYADKGVVWLAINSTHDSTAARNKSWRKDHELPYAVLDDARRQVAGKFGISTVPFYIIIDKHGTIAYSGSFDDDEDRNPRKRDGTVNFVDRAIEELTSGRSVSKPTGLNYGCPLK
jgi:peroxiredoxin